MESAGISMLGWDRVVPLNNAGRCLVADGRGVGLPCIRHDQELRLKLGCG